MAPEAAPARGAIRGRRHHFDLQDAIRQEMRNAGQNENFPQLERHHHLPRQFWDLLPKEIDPESAEYVSWLLRELHRLKPQGMHTGDQNWNKAWAKFLEDDYNRRKPRIDRNLDIMIRNFLKRIRGDTGNSVEE